VAQSVASLAKLPRSRDLHKAQNNLFWLATEVLDYTLLTEEFHKPMLDEWDQRRRLRAMGKWNFNELEMWARDYYKTTCRVAQIVQDILHNPNVAIMVSHAVEEKAGEMVEEIADKLQKCKALRRLAPEGVLPAHNKAKFMVKHPSPQFTVNRSTYKRHPTVRGKGAGSEITGGHCEIIYPDDIIGYNTIRDNQMPHIRNWHGLTVRNVLRTGIGYELATGTHWDPEDIYMDWRKSSRWVHRIRACYETDGKPDWKGKPVLYTREQIENKRADMTEWQFAAQMMNDPIPSTERIWDSSTCEHVIEPKEATGAGRLVVLSDPAPRGIGSLSGKTERERKDNTRDYWATCVCKLRVHGNRQELILLDGQASRDWTRHDGFEEIAEFAKYWNTNLVGVEATGQAIALYEEDLRDSARRVGAKITPVKLAWTYLGKKNYFEHLASKATRHEFLYVEPHKDFQRNYKKYREFLDVFLEQARTMRFHGGRPAVRFDDHYNVVSFGVDAALQQYAPKPHTINPLDRIEHEEHGEYRQRTRYTSL
jgi:hypothetical protein